MFAEVLTGIALVQKSVEFIKSNIGTANDIRDIDASIDDLFTGEQQAQKLRNKKAAPDAFGVSSVAQEVIDAKLAQEKIYEVSVLVDQRFGHGTWQGIVSERARRIQEAKEAARQEKIEKNKRQHEFVESMKQLVLILTIILFLAGCFFVAFYVA